MLTHNTSAALLRVVKGGGLMFGSMVGGRVAAGNDQHDTDLRESQLRSKGGGIRKWSVYSVDRHARGPTMPVGAAGKRSSFLMGRMAQGLSSGRIATEERWTRWARVFSLFDHNGQQWMKLRRGVNHPQSAFSATWNILGAAFIVMCVLFIPFEMTFDYETRFGGSFSQGFWHVMNPVMDVFFLLDLAVHFRTAFEEDGELVQDWASIAKRYLLGWFVLDFLSSISSVLVYLMQAQEYGNLRNVRILRLVRLLKLLRIAKLKQILDNLDGVRAEMRVLAKLLKLLLMCLAITHMIACGFYMVAKKYVCARSTSTFSSSSTYPRRLLRYFFPLAHSLTTPLLLVANNPTNRQVLHRLRGQLGGRVL